LSRTPDRRLDSVPVRLRAPRTLRRRPEQTPDVIAAIARAVPAQNTIRIFVSASTGDRVASIGPSDATVEVSGATPWMAMTMLSLELQKRRYRWDHESILIQ
jgi:hypothetical protein